jgi:hypothetical protein
MLFSSTCKKENGGDEMEPYFSTAQFSAFPVQPWYEKQEMVEAARKHGYDATTALLEDWITKGLVGFAEQSGLGRGRGSVARWSGAQFTLFIECLKARKLGNLRIGQLSAFPVWRWIYWGNRGGVDLPQVKRAMATWVASVKKTTTGKERKDARRAVEKLQGARFSGKLALINELTAIGAFQKEPDSELLQYLLEEVVMESPPDGVSDQGCSRSADIEMLATMFPLRLSAFQQYEQQIASLPDTLWEWARTFLLYMQLQGQKAQPLLAKDPRFANRYRRLTVYDVLWGSCYDLLVPLSVVVPMLSAGKPTPHLRPCFHPQNWRSGEATGLIKTNVVSSPIVLPDGDNLLSLRNELFIMYQESVSCFALDLPFL